MSKLYVESEEVPEGYRKFAFRMKEIRESEQRLDCVEFFTANGELWRVAPPPWGEFQSRGKDDVVAYFYCVNPKKK